MDATNSLKLQSDWCVVKGRLPHRKATMSNGENDQHAGSNPAKRTIPKLLVLLKNVGKLLGMKSVTELRGGADCTARLTLHQQSGGFVSEKPVCTWLRENVLRRHSGANGISGALLPKHLH